MALHIIRKGLDLPIAGAPEQKIHPGAVVRSVAIVADDYVGMRPTMHVTEGSSVKRGQLVFEDKKTPGVRFVAPGAGTVTAVNRGARRALQSVVIELEEETTDGELSQKGEIAFESYTGKPVPALTRDDVVALLVESALWTALRTRPFSRVPDPATEPHSIFVTAMDTHPLAADVDAVVQGREAELEAGLICLAKLTKGVVYFCKSPNSKIAANPHNGVQTEEFQGPHPAGAVGLHIHTLDPVSRNKTVWHIGYQDVIAIGALFTTGRLHVERIVSLAGPSVKNPRLVRTRLGASLDDLTAGQLREGEHRVISGSVLSGRAAMGPLLGYLGRYANQVSVLPEDRERRLLGWMTPGTETFSVTNTFASALARGRKLFSFSTTSNGARRAIVPIGLYEKVMPMDIMATFMVRALVMDDVERAEELGVLELDEEDLALCTFVCPSKQDYGSALRRNLTRIEKEG